MAGKPGKSGGARPGSGPRKRPIAPLNVTAEDPLEFLLAVMKSKKAAPELRVRAAICAAQYTHVKTKDGGLKLAKSKAAKAAGDGKFRSSAPPKLVVDNS